MATNNTVHSLIMQIQKTQFLFRQVIQRKLKEHKANMTFEMLQIMARIWKQEGVNQQTLAFYTSKDKASLTYLINNLEKRGWVIRQEDSEDRRNRLIYLTPEGKTLRDRIIPLLDEIYEQAEIQVDKQHTQQWTDYLSELDEIFKNL